MSDKEIAYLHDRLLSYSARIPGGGEDFWLMREAAKAIKLLSAQGPVEWQNNIETLKVENNELHRQIIAMSLERDGLIEQLKAQSRSFQKTLVLMPQDQLKNLAAAVITSSQDD